MRGTNGIGKSTLLRLLAGAQPADAGRVWIDGIDLMQAPEDAKRRLSYLPDESPIYPFMTGEELLHFVAAVKRTRIDATADGLIRAFDLARHPRTRVDAGSLGARKKLMLCAAWIGAPRVPLLDGPATVWTSRHATSSSGCCGIAGAKARFCWPRMTKTSYRRVARP